MFNDILDDIQLPVDNMKLSLVTHKASNLVDIHHQVPAISLPYDKKKVHRIVTQLERCAQDMQGWD